MERIEQANKEALRRILSGEPELIDVCPAGEVIPELDNHSIGHAGPPIAWEEMCGPMQGAIMGAAVYEGQKWPLPVRFILSPITVCTVLAP